MKPIETRLFELILDLYEEIKSMTPTDGFSSPRDIELLKKVNMKSAVLDNLQEAMRVINPDFEIREK